MKEAYSAQRERARLALHSARTCSQQPATLDVVPVLTGLKGRLASLGPFGLRPLTPAARQDELAIVAGCARAQPCPWRGLRSKGNTTTSDPQFGNVYQKQRNADGTTDVLGSNARTGSQWDQHYDPG